MFAVAATNENFEGERETNARANCGELSPPAASHRWPITSRPTALAVTAATRRLRCCSERPCNGGLRLCMLIVLGGPFISLF